MKNWILLISMNLIFGLTGCGSESKVLQPQGNESSNPAPNTQPAETAGLCTETFTSDVFVENASVNNHNGWAVDPTANFNEKVVNLGSQACRGKGVWLISSNVVSGGFGNQPRSPAMSESAGESTVRSAGGGDTMEVIFWVKPVAQVADGSSVTFSMSPTSADRHVYLRIINNKDINGGFQFVMIDSFDFNNTSNYRTINLNNFDRTRWNKVRLVSTNPDGSSNDIFDVYINDVKKGGYTSWEDVRTSINGFNSPTLAVTRGLWRMSALPSTVDSSFSDSTAAGFYIDDYSQKIYNAATPGTILQHYETGFEVP